MIRNFSSAALVALSLFLAVPGYSADVGELERRIDMMSDELDRLKSSEGSGGGIADHTTVHGYGNTRSVE